MRPPAPWMDNSQIGSLQQLRNKFRKKAHQTGSQESWELCRDVRNKLKAAIRRARETFTRQALSSNKPKEVWRIIHRILKPNQQPLRQGSTAERTLPVKSDLPFCIEELIESLPNNSPANFKLRQVSHSEVLRLLKCYDLTRLLARTVSLSNSLKWWLIPLLAPSQLLSTTVSGNTTFLRPGKMRGSVQFLK